jgi:ribosomal protein L29
MKKSELEELRQLSVSDLEASIKESREELLKGRFEEVTDSAGLGVRSRMIRRKVACMLTIINEKKKVEVQA